MTKYGDVVAFLQALGFGRLDSFDERKRTQKVVYLLKQFGAELPFGYSWYIHGPYSPQLTRTLLNTTEADLRSTRKLGVVELEIVNKARNFLADDFYSVDSLELIVSLIYLIKHGPKEGYDTKRAIIAYLRKKKSQFDNNEIERAWNKIEESGVWRSYVAMLHD
jgi:uncharacterized protein YwgA